MPRAPSRHGLRITVRFNGAVVGQTVRWPGMRGGAVGATGEEAVPTRSGEPLVRVRWEARDRARLEPVDASAEAGVVTPDSPWRWSNGAGVDVDADMVPWQPAARRDPQPGDAALFALMLALTVAVGQANVLFALLFGGSGQASPYQPEPSPEYIARLLQHDYDGEEQGLPERAQDPDLPNGAPSYFLPSGGEGPLVRIGGGAVAGEHVSRARADPDAEAASTAPEAPPAPESQPQGQQTIATDADSAVSGLPGVQSEASTPASPPEAGPPTPMERFIGWGFRDWFQVKDDRSGASEQMRRDLNLVRRRLRINPNDPGAVNTLGYYAYLAENYDLGRETFQKMIVLYPEDPSGYNNLGLIYKRSGDYTTEEALYRKALDLDPLDTNVMNNLAVCLAHQGRFDEALQIMDALEDLDPNDPYAELHRAKIYAAMGKPFRALKHLESALDGAKALDTMHHIEFRQDIRIDPAFDALRSDARFRKLLTSAYGADAADLLDGRDAAAHTPRRPFWRSRG